MCSGNCFTFPELFACIPEQSNAMWNLLINARLQFIKVQEHGNYISRNFWKVNICFHPTQEQKEKERLLYETSKKN